MRTKIIATIGPTSGSSDMIKKFVNAGMDIARINFSHATKESFVMHKKWIASAAREAKRKVLIMQDLQGPRLRVGVMPPEGRLLKEKEIVTITTKEERPGTIFIDGPKLHKDIRVGEPIYLANGEMELVARRIADGRITAEVVRGGILYSRKAVNLPGTKLSDSGLTPKDMRDVKFAVSHGVDIVAISFVQSAGDIRALRKLTGKKIRIVAKIETALAVANIDEIIKESDAIMIARGDLGIEVPIEKIPFIQKNLIRHATWYGKGSITATQMLTSMVNHPRPTRAEVSDIANAVWDGTDAVMLSDETASGKYPLEALRVMERVVSQAERSHFDRPNPLTP